MKSPSENESKQKAINLLNTTGLPSKKDENWHYTNLKSILAHFDANKLDRKIENSVTAKNHDYSKIELDSFASRSNLLDDDVIRQINIAGFNEAIELHIEENKKSDEFIKIESKPGHNGVSITADKGCASYVLEHHLSCSDPLPQDLSSFVSLVNVNESASLNYVILRNQKFNYKDLQKFAAKIKSNSRLNLYCINIGNTSSLTRQDIEISIEGENACFNLYSINLLQEKAHFDLKMLVNHSQPNSYSREIIRNVCLDKANGNFQGLIKVAQIAQKTEAKMSCNSLLISEDSSFKAKPELEIFADDVICGHGATIAPLNQEQLFYLVSRGIDSKQAKSLLMKAFINELVEQDAKIADILQESITNWVESV